jgi:hypothetical protein
VVQPVGLTNLAPAVRAFALSEPSLAVPTVVWIFKLTRTTVGHVTLRVVLMKHAMRDNAAQSEASAAVWNPVVPICKPTRTTADHVAMHVVRTKHASTQYVLSNDLYLFWLGFVGYICVYHKQ